MITFYEGMPRSGKSYTCVRDEIIPALKKGRPVVAYIEGLNHAQIAQLAEIDFEKCEELLKAITREEAGEIYKHVKNDALVVIDEVQNFWPSGRQKLDADMTRFITEHGHLGLDIIIMGQAIKDIHNLWRRRTERKVYFYKKSALGKPNEYTAIFYNAVPKGDDVVFNKILSRDYTYEEKYFGTYKSHTDETRNKETKIDKRAVIWNHPIFRRWLPLFAVGFAFALYYVYGLFHGGFENKLVKNQKPIQTAQGTIIHQPVAAPAAAAAVPAPAAFPEPDEPPDLVQELTQKNRIRFIGWWRSGNQTNALIEWRDAGGSLVHAMNTLDLSGLGWNVYVNQQGTIASLQRGKVRLIATSWQIDRREGRTSETTQERVAGHPADERPISSAAIGEPFPQRSEPRLVDAEALHRG